MKKLIFMFLFAVLGMAASAQQAQPTPSVDYGENVFVIELETFSGDTVRFLQVGENPSGLYPSNLNDLPTMLHQYVSNFTVFINVNSKVNGWSFTMTGGDGLMDNFGNLYVPISDFD